MAASVFHAGGSSWKPVLCLTVPGCAGCADCDAASAPGWWLHLRRCASCRHIGCYDDPLARHATAQYRATGHPIQSFEPGEDWFDDYRTDDFAVGPELAPPHSHPVEQGVPGPLGRVPEDWERWLGSRQLVRTRPLQLRGGSAPGNRAAGAPAGARP
jgi:Zn-finger in ubiquitin-hydrolases and other protein